VPQVLVLSIGMDETVLDTRALILQSAGYTVVSAMAVQEAATLLLNSDFDIIVLCHTVPTKDSKRLISMVRASGSRIPIVTVTSDAFGPQSSIADATLDKEPVAFLREMHEVLRDHAQPQAQRRRA
jgi:CheY-like chemotaxis protein